MQNLCLCSTAVGAIAAAGVSFFAPAYAQVRQITQVEIWPTELGLAIGLKVEQAGQAAVRRTDFGSTVVFDLSVTQLAAGINLSQDAPIDGIDLISVQPLDNNSVRIQIVGTDIAPTVTISYQGEAGIALNVSPNQQPSGIRCRRCEPPNYPEAALREEIEGTVRLKVELNAEGFVTDALVIRSSGNASLDQAAYEAVLNYEFDPNYQQSRSFDIEIPFVINADSQFPL